jgi:isopenicillin N synthase-like dioxygenase
MKSSITPSKTLHIPSIDISQGLANPGVITQLANACEEWGFFQLTGHGINTALRTDFFAAMTEFFALPLEKKTRLSRNQENFWGYFDKELTKNKQDSKEIFDIDGNLDNLRASQPNFAVPWPPEQPELQQIVSRWLAEVEHLSRRLLEALCVALGQPPKTLNASFAKNHSSFLRFNYYPVLGDEYVDCTEGSLGKLGIHPHTDSGALTVLAQDDVAGLQVKKDGGWHTVTPDQDSLIINLGDMMQVWSNDRFTAGEHRVLASSSQARFSAPYFYNPSYKTHCIPLTSPPRYKPILWNEYRSGRAAGDYADVGEEIQIAWYRL